MLNQLKSIIFSRVSSKEQEETGYSLPAQEKLLTGYAESKGFRIAKPFSISESASGKKQRETFNEMMTYVDKNNIKVIIIEKVDRLTRNFKDAVMIDEWLEADGERQVHFVKDSLILHRGSRSQEKLNWGIRIIFAKNYIDNLSEEVKKGQLEKLAQGWLPTKPPLGYKTVGEKGHKIHIIDEQKAPLVRKMFELYATREYSIKRLTEEMFKEGLRNDNGNRVTKSRIHEYLNDPFYIGKNRWKEIEYPGSQEPLIEEPTFDNIQSILRSKTTPKLTKHNFLFKSLIKCFGCGGLITWETKKGHIYGHCNHYRNCQQHLTDWPQEYEVDEQLAVKFRELEVRNKRLAEWIRKALKESHIDEVAFHSTSVGEINKQHDLIKRRLDNLYIDKLDDKISEGEYQRHFKRFSGELKATDKSLNKHTDATLRYFELGVNYYELSQKAELIYRKALLDQKRMFVRMVFSDLVLNEGTLTFKYTPAFQILADAVAATNSSKMAESVKSLMKILEPQEKVDISRQTGAFATLRPALLLRLDSNQQPSP